MLLTSYQWSLECLDSTCWRWKHEYGFTSFSLPVTPITVHSHSLEDCRGDLRRQVYESAFNLQKEVFMGPKGASIRVIQQVRNDHTKVFLKLHDEGTTSDQRRRVELRGPSRHHIEAVKYDLDQKLKAAGQTALPALDWSWDPSSSEWQNLFVRSPREWWQSVRNDWWKSRRQEGSFAQAFQGRKLRQIYANFPIQTYIS